MLKSEMAMLFKNLWDEYFRRYGEKAPSQVGVKRQARIRQAWDKDLHAIAFAEAGAHDLARQVLADFDREPPKILVISSMVVFNPEVIEYTVRLASSLRCRLVAVNVCTDLWSQGEKRTAFEKLRWEVFEQQSTEAVVHFRSKAEECGVAFQHMVRYGSLKKAMRTMESEMKRIRFIVTAPEIDFGASDQKTGVPIFSFKLSKGFIQTSGH
ncbi:MAG: hypothetical protein JRI76_08955 [Deltaproteobacteria bacterium]|nr:hypothetical protein [Deltaproteobacteria bacterium]MBW2042147.1 hypothetical protein [Deltaproteobacteria bacterium]